MKKLLGGLFVVMAFAVQADAASITNGDTSAIVLGVVENGNRLDVAIEPGASETICPGGCFITLPNGDRLGLGGSEDVQILNGSAVVK